MKTIGLIGGLSWHSTAAYYERINEQVARRLGGHASAVISMQSLDFAEIRDCQLRGDWEKSAQILSKAAGRCEAGGADMVALCTNLMHKNFDAIEQAVTVPTVHIADAIADVARRHRWRSLGVLGTRWVMEEAFYADRLALQGIVTVVPDSRSRALVDRVIFEELTQGRVLDNSRNDFAAVINQLADQGADAVVLACTEIGRLMGDHAVPLPTIDSATAHADNLVELALAKDQP